MCGSSFLKIMADMTSENAVYTGKNENNNLSNIICKLWMNYEGENYYLYIDRYYTSINALIGTILKNRIWKNDEISKDIKLLNKREYKFYKNKDQLQITVWKDKKDVFILTKFRKQLSKELVSVF